MAVGPGIGGGIGFNGPGWNPVGWGPAGGGFAPGLSGGYGGGLGLNGPGYSAQFIGPGGSGLGNGGGVGANGPGLNPGSFGTPFYSQSAGYGGGLGLNYGPTGLGYGGGLGLNNGYFNGQEPGRRTVVRRTALRPLSRLASYSRGALPRLTPPGHSVEAQQVPEAPPYDMEAQNYVALALANPSGEAAANLGLSNNSLTEPQKQEMAQIVASSQAEPSSWMGKIGDMLMSFLGAVGSFVMGKGFNYSQQLAERVSTRAAVRTYEALNAPDATGASRPYGAFAASVSGVEPDGQGGYRPVVREDGTHTGMLARHETMMNGEARARLSDDRDAGRVPSEAQLFRSRTIINEELNRLYSDPATRRLVDDYRARLAASPGKNEEAEMFWRDERIRPTLERIATRIAEDPEVKAGGRYDFTVNKATLLGQLEAIAKRRHLEFFEAPGNARASPGPAVNMLAAQLQARLNDPAQKGFEEIGRAWAQTAKARGASDPAVQRLEAYINSGEAYGDVSFRGLPAAEQAARLKEKLKDITALPGGAPIEGAIDSMTATTRQALDNIDSRSLPPAPPQATGFSGAAPPSLTPAPPAGLLPPRSTGAVAP